MIRGSVMLHTPAPCKVRKERATPGSWVGSCECANGGFVMLHAPAPCKVRKERGTRNGNGVPIYGLFRFAIGWGGALGLGVCFCLLGRLFWLTLLLRFCRRSRWCLPWRLRDF